MKPLAAPASHGVLGQQEKQSVSIQGLPASQAARLGGRQCGEQAGSFSTEQAALLFSRGSGALEGSDSLLRGGRRVSFSSLALVILL